MSDQTPLKGSNQPNAHEQIEVSSGDLPLHCPMPDSRLWDSHPRVFLPIEKSGKETCPYCGTKYILIDSAGSAD